MATSNVGATLKKKMERARVELGRSQRTALNRGGSVLVAAARKEMPERLRNVGKNGAKIGARYFLKGDDAVQVQATGPAHIVDNPTKAHEIGPKKARAKKRTGKGAGRGGGVVIAGEIVRRKVKHPGTKGKHTFDKGIAKGKDAALRAVANPITDAVKRGLSS